MNNKGLTLFELLVVTAIVAILAGSSAPFLARNITWFYDIAKDETAINELYDTGLAVSRAVSRDRNMVASFSIDADDNLRFGDIVLQERVDANFDVISDDLVVFTISTIGPAEQRLRFLISPAR